MKAKEVMEALRISRSTLYNLRKQKALDHHVLPNGHYEYDEESVYKYLLRTLGKSPQRKTVIYARVRSRQEINWSVGLAILFPGKERRMRIALVL